LSNSIAARKGIGDENMMQPHSGPRKSEDVAYAKTRAGFELPVIDVTNLRFAVPDDPAKVRGL
jgi:hypothetical protein